MAVQTLEWISVGLSLLACAGIVLLLLRRSAPAKVDLTEVRRDIERLERTATENDSRSFNNAEARGDALRKEVAENIQRFSDQLAASVALVGDTQKARFENFEKTLTTQVKSVDDKLAQLSEKQQASLSEFGKASVENGRALRDEIANRLKSAADELRQASETAATLQKERLEELGNRLKALGESIGASFEQFRQATETRLTELRTETNENLKGLRAENEQKLEAMRLTVDEKLHDTLEKRLGEQFSLVVQQLKAVHEGLNDMQRVATGVGDLKRVLTNVKVRGTWVETQLAAILEDMLTPDQYERNVKVKDGSSEIVEFCIRIPKLSEGEEPLLLPLDAKFPTEDYERLQAFADAGDSAGVEAAAQKLESRFRSCAKEISSKYLAPPRTTDFAIMYVPSEGLYAEIVKRPGLASSIMREFNVLVAGPMNLMSIVNSVHAITRSVTIQQKAGHIAALLLKVQNEFAKYGKAVAVAKKRAQSTVNAMEDLEQRQRAMGKALKGVKSIDDGSLIGANGNVDLVTYTSDVDDESEEQDRSELAESDDELALDGKLS